jgi:hypothetical protein
LVRVYLGYLMRSERDGLGPLATEQEFLAAVRPLADAVLADGAVLDDSTIVEHTPEHAMIAGFIAATYPDAHLVEVVRDGRVVTHSMINGPGRRYRFPIVAARHWAEAHRRIDDVRGTSPVHTIHLEQLLDAPEASVRALAAAVDIPADAEAIEHATSIVDRARARYRPALGALSTAAAEQEGADVLARLGYGEASRGRVGGVLRAGWRVVAGIRRPSIPSPTERGTTRDALLMEPLHPGAASKRFAGELIVILGAPRSGTTWLEELLHTHPLVAGVPQGETRIFWALAPLWRAHARADAATRDRLTVAVRTFCDRLLGACVDRTNLGATHFVEKTPAHAQLLSQIEPVYPDAWYVHIVRDGRDVARSLARMEVDGLEKLDLGEATHEWVRLNRLTMRDAPAAHRYRMVRYEELLVDPVASACELLEWVGLTCDDALRARLASIAGVPVSQHAGKGRVGAGKWREDLSDAQLDEVYAAGGELLVELGYLEHFELVEWQRRPARHGVEVRRRGRELLARVRHPAQRVLRPLRVDEPWFREPVRRRR